MKNKVLLLLAHPSLHRSEINKPLFRAAQVIEGVTCVDLYAEYPRFNIDIDKEQQRLNEHDVIVFQFPLYWYSTPAILKEWQDLVLEYGFAYGAEGTALTGKILTCVVSAGGKQEAYQTEGYNQFTVRQLLAPIEQMASLTDMSYLAPLTLFGSRTAVEDQRISQHLQHYQLLLKSLVDNSLDIARLRPLDDLAQTLSTLAKEKL